MVYVITVIFILAYALILCALKAKDILKPDSFVNNLTVFVGWLVALAIAGIHLRKNRLDNIALNKAETKKRLEIEAFKELNKAITDLSRSFGSVSVKYWTWPSKLKLHIENPLIFIFNRSEIDLNFSEQLIKLGHAEVDFVTAIEGNEIVIIQFDHFKKFLHLEIEDIKEAVECFRSYFSKVDENDLITREGHLDFEKRCEEMNEQFVQFYTYLYDYRIILMNRLLGQVFETKMPERKPKDPKYKHLTEAAKKEEVEMRFEKRLKKILDCREGASAEPCTKPFGTG